MKDDIKPPVDIRQLIHTNRPDCRACRPAASKAAHRKRRLERKIAVVHARLDALEHCEHTRTKTITMWPNERESDGLVLDEVELTVCLDCYRYVEGQS